MGAINCCQNQAYKQQEFREYCLNQASTEYRDYFKAIQKQQVSSSPQLITQKTQFKQGSWEKQSAQTGKGVIFAPDQFYYQGDVVEGVAKGQGKIIWANKFSFKGSIQENKASGHGQLHLGQKNISLKGNWIRGYPKLNDKMTLNKQGMQGSIIFTDHTHLKTQENYFKEALLNVKLEFNNGITYEGEIKQKNHVYKIEGRGTMIYLDGSYYTGDFVGGQMDGYGKYYWGITGHWFIGEYKSNIREGKGTYYYSQREYESGDWKGGVFSKSQPQKHQQKSPTLHQSDLKQ